jgi:hypothetical protein
MLSLGWGGTLAYIPHKRQVLYYYLPAFRALNREILGGET